MAIHPRYADAILEGSKTVEFRKRRLASDVTTVLIYATAPVQRVVGEFRIRETVVGAPEAVWEAYGTVGEIDRDSYGEHYRQSAQAVALVVEQSSRYPRPKTLAQLKQNPAIPQSFSYLRRQPRRARKATPTE